MYTGYWGLDEPPFGNVPNRELFFPSPQHEEALIRLLYAVEQNKGVAMLTGEVGSGKTTISRVLIDRLPEDRFEVRAIVNPSLNSIELIRAILFAFGISQEGDSKALLLDTLKTKLVANADAGRNTVLIIDEAHLIKDKSSLEELRMLLNLQSDSQFLLTMVVMGQPPLMGNIQTLKPLNERIAIRFDLGSLTLQDTMRYILYRLKNAGASRGFFTKESIRPIFAYSMGIPLRINNLCERCLLIGAMRKARVIDTKIVKMAIEDL
jgi:general secretion pathway protein A